MKKILYLIFAIAFTVPAMASAATFSFSPNSGSFAPGETLSVVVYVNPSVGEEITTAKLSAILPSSNLEIISFSQADGWIPLAAPGSDLIDNVAGKLIKTGGFPARVTEQKQFGVITLKAKSDGVAVMSVADDSMLLDASNINKYVSSAGASFAIATPAPVSEPVSNPAPSVSETEKVSKPAPTTEDTETDTEDVVVVNDEPTTTSVQQSQTAAAADAGSNYNWYYILAVLVLLAGLGIFAWSKRENNS